MQTVQMFVEHLRVATLKCNCGCIYCFMPEHVHITFVARSEWAEPLRAVEIFKQTTGYWFKENVRRLTWQDSSYDKIIRSSRELKNQVNYVVHNPVRRGLVSNWEDYPFTGAIGLDLREFLSDMLWFLSRGFRGLKGLLLNSLSVPRGTNL